MNEELFAVVIGFAVSGSVWLIKVLFFEPAKVNAKELMELQVEFEDMKSDMAQLSTKIAQIDKELKEAREDYKSIYKEMKELAVGVAEVKSNVAWIKDSFASLIHKQKSS